MGVPPAAAASKSRRRCIRLTIFATFAALIVGFASLTQRYLRNMTDPLPAQSLTGNACSAKSGGTATLLEIILVFLFFFFFFFEKKNCQTLICLCPRVLFSSFRYSLEWWCNCLNRDLYFGLDVAGAVTTHHPEILKEMYGCTDKSGKSVACTSGQMKMMKSRGKGGSSSGNARGDFDRILFTEGAICVYTLSPFSK